MEGNKERKAKGEEKERKGTFVLVAVLTVPFFPFLFPFFALEFDRVDFLFL